MHLRHSTVEPDLPKIILPSDAGVQFLGQVLDHIAPLVLLLPTSAEGALRRPLGYADLVQPTQRARGVGAGEVGIFTGTAGS